jgi:hypothetical protein
MDSLQSTSKQPPKFAPCLDTSLEYLLLEGVRFYAALPDEVAAVHAVETMGFRIGFQLAERCAVTQILVSGSLAMLLC